MGDIIDFATKRNDSIEKKRRSFERILFKNLMGAYSVIDQKGSLLPVTLIDISRNGCMFEANWIPGKDNKIKNNTELVLKIYFTSNSFIPANVLIKRSNQYTDDEGRTYMRYGCEFDKSTSSFKALESFIEFLYKFAEYSSYDKGEQKISFL